MTDGLGGSGAKNTSGSLNPFARALAEAKGGQSGDSQSTSFPNSFGNSNLGGALNESGFDNSFGGDQNFNTAEQQKQQAEKLKREKLRQQLHRQINPVESRDVFSAREQHVKKQIDEIRHELEMLGKEVVEFHKDIDLTLSSNIVRPKDGKYYFSFFAQLKQFIILLRNQIHSARTWANTAQNKRKRKKNMIGLEIGGKQHEQTSTIFDQMHEERANAYSGS